MQLNGIYVFADTSGRFDHIMGNINTLYRSDKIIEHVQVIITYLIVTYIYFKIFSFIKFYVFFR